MDQASHETRIAELEAWAAQMVEWAKDMSDTQHNLQSLLRGVGAALTIPRTEPPEPPLPPVQPTVVA